MTTPMVAYPTLDVITYLTNPQDIIAAVLRQYVSVPKSASETFYKQTISLQDTLSRYSYNKQNITTPVMNDLNSVFNNYFSPGTFNVDVTYNNVDTVTYNLIITVNAYISGQSYTAGNSISIDSNNNIIITPITTQ